MFVRSNARTQQEKWHQFVQRMICAVGVLTLGVLCGCSSPRPYYADYLFKPPQLVERDRSYLVRYLDKWLQSGKISRIDIQTPDAGSQSLYAHDGGTSDTDWLPLPVLYAAHFILDPKLKGVEVDLITHLGPDSFVPITARYDVDGRVSLAMGSPMASLLPKTEQLLSYSQLQTLYGIEVLEGNGRRWKPYELYALEQALALLSKEERGVTAGVQFVREARAKKSAKGLKAQEIWGQYHSAGRLGVPRVINLFDVEEEGDMALFVGEPSSPHPLPSMCLLHEIGHAIADYPRLRITEQRHQVGESLQKLLMEWKEAEAAGPLTATKSKELQDRLETFRKAAADTIPLFNKIKESYRRKGGPVLEAFLEARGPLGGPTKYGRKSAEESFAESFALFKADPEALRRIYPDAYNWFAAGGHLEAMGAQ